MKRSSLIAAMLVAFATASVACRATSTPTPATNLNADLAGSRGSFDGWIEAGRLPALRWPNFRDYRDYVRAFYADHKGQRVWLNENIPTPAAAAIIKELEGADAKGLRPNDYDGNRWAQRIARLQQMTPPPTESDRASFDLALTVSLMRYLSDLRRGRANRNPAPFEFDVGDKRDNLPKLITDEFVGARPDAIPDLVAKLEPQADMYQLLEQSLPRYVAMAAKDWGDTLPKPAKTIRPGDPYPGLPRLVELLKLIGDLPPDTGVPSTYQGPIVDGVKHFQESHGLDNDGRLGRATIAAMNVPLIWRVEQIRLTLERWRWFSYDFPQPPIMINLPEFELRTLGTDSANQLEMRVVVGGSAGHRTPLFTAKLRYLIFRPYWNVPMSIQLKELVPKAREDDGFLIDNHFQIVTRSGQVVSDGTVNDDTLDELSAGRLELRQTPGPDNSLGLVKFVFPNPYDVYMHDTPAVQLFAKARRDYSHGCIRVQDPITLALWALRNNSPGWDRDRVVAAMNGSSDNVRVDLAKLIPVMVVYFTAVAKPDGSVNFFNDLYGRDAELEEQLAASYPYH